MAGDNGDAVVAAQQPTDPVEVPTPGEKTGPQQFTVGVGGVVAALPGFGRPSAGTFNTYRIMRSNPTIALARMAATAPIRAATYSFVGTEGAPLQQVEFVKQSLRPLLPRLINDALFGLDYGFKPFEKVWGVDRGRLVYVKLKPLRVDKTVILVEKRHGNFVGLKQGDVELPRANSFVYTHDGEDGDCYGRSRHENVRENAWWPWMETLRKTGQYVSKAAGVLPIVRYLPGRYEDADGTKTDAHEIAQRLLSLLGQGSGVMHPIVMQKWAEDLIRNGNLSPQAIETLMAWNIEFMEVSSGHGGEFISLLKHFEALMMRGWLVPERAATEGTFGTKAEAEAHASLAILAAEQVMRELLFQINEAIVDPLLVVNFGPQSDGNVRLIAAPLVDEQKLLSRQIVTKVLETPQNRDLLEREVDFQTMLDLADIPRAEGSMRLARTPIPLAGRSSDEVIAELYGQVLRAAIMEEHPPDAD